MFEAWQDVLHGVILANPRHFAAWVLPGARYVRTESSQLASGYSLGTVVAGPLLLVNCDGTDLLLHFACQDQDESLDTYMFARHTLASRIYHCPVLSYIIYIRNKEPIITSPLQVRGVDGEELLRFDYKVLKLWEYSVDDLLNLGLSSLLPLLPLTKDGARHEVVDIMIKRMIDADQWDLLRASQVFAEQAFTNEFDHYWLNKKLRAYLALVN